MQTQLQRNNSDFETYIEFFLMLLLPESPRWLVKAGQTQIAREIMRKVYAAGNDVIVEGVLHAIKFEISNEEAASNDVSVSVTGNRRSLWLSRFRNRFSEIFYIGGNRRALTIACLLQYVISE